MSATTERRDHPAQVLYLAAETASVETVSAEEEAGVRCASRLLRSYEQANGVTFECLDTEALAQVREAHLGFTTTDRSDTGRRASYADALASAVADLLGLSD